MNKPEMRGQARSSGPWASIAARLVLSLSVLGALPACVFENGIQRDWVDIPAAVESAERARQPAPGPSKRVARPPLRELHERAQVAVLPFENLTVYPNAGRIAAELITTELYKQGVFTIMEASELEHRLRVRQIDLERLPGPVVAAELAAALDVDAVMFGSVTEYGYQHGLREEPVVGINARLVGADDGKVVWASSHSEAGRGYLRRDSVNEVAQVVVRRMVQTLKREMGPRSSSP